MVSKMKSPCCSARVAMLDSTEGVMALDARNMFGKPLTIVPR